MGPTVNQEGVLAGNIGLYKHTKWDILHELILICRHASQSPKLHCLLPVLTINQAYLQYIHHEPLILAAFSLKKKIIKDGYYGKVSDFRTECKLCSLIERRKIMKKGHMQHHSPPNVKAMLTVTGYNLGMERSKTSECQ